MELQYIWLATSIIGGTATLTGVTASLIGLKIRKEIGELRESLRAEMAADRLAASEHRASDRADLVTWINGSFMRADVVRALVASYNRRIDSLEELAKRMNEQ